MNTITSVIHVGKWIIFNILEIEYMNGNPESDLNNRRNLVLILSSILHISTNISVLKQMFTNF
jgi:hypothetical protein